MYPDQVGNPATSFISSVRLILAALLLTCLGWANTGLAAPDTPQDDCTPPDALTNITYPSVSCSADRRVTVSWPAADGADTYTLERYFNEEVEGASTVYSGPSTTHTDIAPWPGTFHYRVRANNECGSTGWFTGGGILVTGLETPSYISYPSQDGNGSFLVSWNFAEYADGYTLQRATDALFSDASVVYMGDGVLDTDFLESGLAVGVYYYRVRSDYDLRCGTSSEWRVGGAVTVSDSPVGEVSSIDYPSKACSADGSVTVSWTAATGATTYTLQRSRQPEFSPVDYVYQGADTSYTDSVPIDGVYYYRVRAANEGERSDWREGGAVSVYTLEAPSYIVCPTFDCDGSFQMVWDNIRDAGLIGYTLQRATNASFSNAVVINGGSDPRDYVYNESGLSNGVYYYRVRAEYDCPGSSDWFATGSITVNYSPPGEVAGVTYPSSVCNADGSVEISWSAASNVSGYHIQRSTSLSFSTPDTFGDWSFTPSYTDSVPDDGVYYYRVRGVNELGYSEWRVGPPMSLAVMATPSGINYPSSDSDGAFPITWQPVGGRMVSYTLQRATNPSFSNAVVVSGGASPTSPSYAESGLAAGVYYYRVRANYDCPGSSEWRAGGAVTVSEAPSSLARIDIVHSSPSDLVVELGTGDPQNPVWNSVIWNSGDGTGLDRLNLEVDLSGLVSHLPPSKSEPWYLRVYDGSSGGRGDIQGFSIAHDGRDYASDTVPVPIDDFSTCYAYINRTHAPFITGTLKLLLREPIYSVTGSWVLYFSWDCSDTWYYTDAVIYDDNTFTVADGSWHGTWALVGNSFTATVDDGSRFTGTLTSDSNHISGSISDTGFGTGCWYAVKLADD